MNYIYFFIIPFFFFSCNKVNNDELWREKRTLSDGSHVFVYHSSWCKENKPLIVNKEKIIDFAKYKYDVYDFCIDEEEAKMLNCISKKNIKGYLENAYFEDDRYSKKSTLLDTTNRSHKCYFSMQQNGELKKLKSPYFP